MIVDDFVNNARNVRATWNPAGSITAIAPMTVTAQTKVYSAYFVLGNELFYDLSFTCTLGVGASGGIDVPMPVTTIQNSAGCCIGNGSFSNFIIQPQTLNVTRNGSSFRLSWRDGTNFPLGACAITIQGRYRIDDR